MLDKGKKSAVLIGHFVLTNLVFPITVYQLGKDLYIIWFKKD